MGDGSDCLSALIAALTADPMDPPAPPTLDYTEDKVPLAQALGFKPIRPVPRRI